MIKPPRPICGQSDARFVVSSPPTYRADYNQTGPQNEPVGATHGVIRHAHKRPGDTARPRLRPPDHRRAPDDRLDVPATESVHVPTVDTPREEDACVAWISTRSWRRSGA